jgi:hypothetical protein
MHFAKFIKYCIPRYIWQTAIYISLLAVCIQGLFSEELKGVEKSK